MSGENSGYCISTILIQVNALPNVPFSHNLSPMEDLIGKQLGAFQIVEHLGEGGMASVYKAYQPRMDRYVALKVLPRYFSQNPEFVSRFSLEARVIAKLEHLHILPVYDFGESDGFTYLAMRLLEGGSLSDLLREHGKLPLPEINRIIAQVGGALDYAHQQGVIHRDIKPENVLTDAFDNCLLTDFGIAKMIEATAHLTHTGGILGTPSYISPEQGTGKPIDHRSDIYSLGIVLYRMTVGDLPYKADNPMGIVFKHCYEPIPLPCESAPDMPESLERVILKALAKEPDERYSTVGEMVGALQEVVGASAVSEPVQERVETSPVAPIEKSEPPPPEPLESEKPATARKSLDEEETMLEPAAPKTRRKLPWVVVVQVFLALVIVAAWFWTQKMKPASPVNAFLYVKTEPEKADVKLLNADISFHQGVGLELGRYQMEVSAVGYETRKIWVDLDAKGEKRIDIQLKPLTVALYVDTEPENANVNILNIDEPFRQGMAIKLGRYHVQVSADGYETQKIWLDLDTAGEKRAKVDLKSIVASLYVNTEPEKANVKLLNSDTPFRQGINLKLGRYYLEVSAEGYETQKKWVKLDSGGDMRVSIRLKPITDSSIVGTEPNEASEIQQQKRLAEETYGRVVTSLTISKWEKAKKLLYDNQQFLKRNLGDVRKYNVIKLTDFFHNIDKGDKLSERKPETMENLHLALKSYQAAEQKAKKLPAGIDVLFITQLKIRDINSRKGVLEKTSQEVLAKETYDKVILALNPSDWESAKNLLYEKQILLTEHLGEELKTNALGFIEFFRDIDGGDRLSGAQPETLRNHESALTFYQRANKKSEGFPPDVDMSFLSQLRINQTANRIAEMEKIRQEAMTAKSAKAVPLQPSTLIKAIEFSGNTVIDTETLVKVTEPYTDRELTLDELKDLVDLVTITYQEEGYILARAYLPHHDVVDGRLHVSISEGYVDVIEVVGERKDKADILMSYFAPQMKHKVIKQSLLESGIKAAHKLQGVETEVILKKGFKPGSVKITLNTKNKKKPFMELLKPPPKPFEIYIEMEEEEELDLSQDQPSYIDNARHIIEKMKEIFDLDLNDPNEIATKISDLYMTHKDLFTDLVTLNILTKYFITIRYNLNKILLS